MPGKAILSKVIYSSAVLCFFASIALFGTVEGAQTTTPAKQPRYGGTLKYSDYSDGTFIGYPPKMNRVSAFRQAAPAVETLLRYDKEGKLKPWLASGFKENDKARTITLMLRKGVKFHDGTDFNAEAVKWNLDQCIAAKSPGTDKFKSIDVVDDYTVRINLTEWDSTVSGNLTQNIGFIISPTAYKKNGEEWCANNPVGTGPFEFVSWQKDARTIYKKFPGYWQKGKPYLDRIEFLPIVDPLTRQMSFRAGELDVALMLDAKDIPNLKKDGFPVVPAIMGAGANSIVPSSANPKSPWADVRVRRAAQYAIDSKAIVQGVVYGQAEPTNQYAHKAHWAYNPAVKGYPYDPAKAKQLLAEAGYPNGFKTTLYFGVGRDPDVYTAVQGYLKAVGIDVQVEPTEYGKLQKFFWGDSWDGFLIASGSPVPDTLVPLLRFFTSGKQYVSMEIPDDFRKAIQNGVTAPDFKTKQKWAQEVMKLMIDKYCLHVMLYVRQDFGAFNKKVHDTGFNATADASSWTPENAWIEQ